ncbi:MAG: IS256 family transposase, partial [Alphaproteobacteria bacterium]|nr:IS256 family transposase [Alphaproteobacteria bacterium]
MLPKDPDATWLKRGKRSYFGYKGFAVVASFLAQHSEERLENGRQRVVRQGHLPE